MRGASGRPDDGVVKRVLLWTLRYLLAAAALAAAYYSAVFARASYLFEEDTATSVPAAASLVPYNGSYIARLAAWRPADKDTLLHRAVQLNEFDYQTWIQLALAAEMQQHDLPLAERYYLRAAEVNHMFLPKWTLTNFYFRNEQPDKFFRWAKATLQISPYQADPVFTQMWLISQDPAQIAAALPDKVTVLLQYTNFLIHTGQFAPVPPIVERITHATGNGSPPVSESTGQILPAEDRILAAGQLHPALAVWQSMALAGWIDLRVPSPTSPLSNGDFARRFLGHGFDWNALPVPGLTVEQSEAQKSVNLTLSGDEPERCVLMQQYIPLEANRAYHLQWRAETQTLDAPSGIAWHVHSTHAGGGTDLAGGDILAANPGTERGGAWDFQSPSISDVCLLTVEYGRPLGKLRANGTITLRSVLLQEK